MFGLFKPKMTVRGFADVLTSTIHRIVTPSSNPTIQALLNQYVEAGANAEAIEFDIAAMQVFSAWWGAAQALQKKKLNVQQYEAFQAAFWNQLRTIMTTHNLDKACNAHRGSDCFPFIEHRAVMLITIITETDHLTALNEIVETVCDWLTTGTIPTTLSLFVRNQCVLNTLTVLDLVSRTKLIVSVEFSD